MLSQRQNQVERVAIQNELAALQKRLATLSHEEEEELPGAKRIRTPRPLPKPKATPVRAIRYETRVINLITGYDLIVRDFSNRQNRKAWEMVREAKTEVGYDGPTSDAVVNILVQALRKGMRPEDFKPHLVPAPLLHRALYTVERPTKRKRELSTSQEEAPTIEVGEEMPPSPTMISRYRGVAESHSVSMRQLGGGLLEDLAATQQETQDMIRDLFNALQSCRLYIVYQALMLKTFVDGKGQTQESSRIVSFSSVDEEATVILHKLADIPEVTSRMFTNVIASITDYSELGSGFTWASSIAMEAHGMQYKSTFQQQRTVKKPPKKRSRKGKEKVQEKEKEEEDEDGEEEEVVVGGKYIKTPKWAIDKKALFNPHIDDEDQHCFAIAILMSLHQVERSRTRSVKKLLEHLDEIQLPPNTSYPIPLSDRFFQKVEKLNDTFSFSIVHIGKQPMTISPFYVSQTRGTRPNHILLGVLFNTTQTNAHFVLVKNLSRLCNTTGGDKRFFCERCILGFPSEASLASHEKECSANMPTKVKMPSPGGPHHFLSFKSWHYRLQAPFIIYADFEATLEPPSEEQQGKVESVHHPSGWAYIIVCSENLKKKYAGDNLVSPLQIEPLHKIRSYVGGEAMRMFYESILHDVAALKQEVMDVQLPYIPVEVDKGQFEQASSCHVCEKEFDAPRGKDMHMREAQWIKKMQKKMEGMNEEERRAFVAGNAYDKVLDHDHLTGLYRGAAHRDCNAHFTNRRNFTVPVAFHNLKGYDSYHLIRGIEPILDDIKKIDCIAKGMDKYTSITIDDIRFIDSFQFIQGSLASHVKNLAAAPKGITDENRARLEEDFAIPLQVFKADYADTPAVTDDDGTNDAHVLNYLLSKGLYPYEWMDSLDKMNDPLPKRKHFHSSLTGDTPSKEDYAGARAVYENFECGDMYGFTLFYVKLDVVLLAAIFEKFRAESFASYRLDPAHFMTAPSLSWHALLLRNYLRDTPLKIENMVDVDMMLMVEKGIRGGMCQVMNPRATANFEGMKGEVIGTEYNPEEAERRIFYWDANNLYGWAMSQALPIGEYRWVLNERLKGFCDLPAAEEEDYEPAEFRNGVDDTREIEQMLERMTPDQDFGYILEVDLIYPDGLHTLHNDYPLGPQMKHPNASPFTRKEAERLGLNISRATPSSPKKLILDLEDKTNYVLHYRNLQFYLQLGMILTKVHRIIRFKQCRWLRDYIEFNTTMRRKCTNKAGQDFYKLMNNAIFGKTMEQVRKRKNIEFFGPNDFEKASKRAGSPYAKQFRIIIDDKLMIMEKRKESVTLNRPVILGNCILELSKLLMYQFHYETMLPRFGDRIKLLYTDTDSTAYQLSGLPPNSASPPPKLYKELYTLQEEVGCFDLSELLPGCPIMDAYGTQPPHSAREHARVLGKMKDEMRGQNVLEFVALRPKMYSVLLEDGHSHARRKGVPRTVSLKHEDYVAVHENGEKVVKEFQKINHDKQMQLITVRERKIALSSCDDKSYYINKDECLRYGHKDIPGIEEQQRVWDQWQEDMENILYSE